MPYSPAQLKTIQSIVSIVDQLEQHSADLKQALSQSAVLSCRCFSLPRTRREDESLPVDRITPEPLRGSESFTRTLHALTDWYGEPEYSTKIVNRTPGALAVTNIDEPEILHLVATINRLKASIEDLVPDLGSRDDRFDLLHTHFRWLILNQLTRRLQVMPSSPPLQSCTFTWGIKTEIKKVTVDDVCRRLESLRRRPRPTGDEVPWDVKIDREITALQSLQHTSELRWRRPLRVRPRATLRFYSIDDAPPETYLREAHTPILILNPTRRVNIGTLKPYSVEAGLRRERVKDRGTYERVSDLMPVYLRKGGAA
jgi:DNA replication terminus site-binding protein